MSVEMNVHIDGTPDVPDIIHPGDWLELTESNGFVSYVLVVKVFKTKEGEWDHCPGVESWTIQYLGTGYLRKEENLSVHDCCWENNIVAVNGELLELYKLGWNEESKRRVVSKPDYDVTVTKSAESLIRRLNPTIKTVMSYPLQLPLFAEVVQ